MRAQQSRRQFIRDTGLLGLAATSLPSAWAGEEKKITLGFVGVAHIHTLEYIRLTNTRSDVRVKSVWDHDAARAEKAAKELNAKAVAEAKEIWSDPEITAVVVCSETNRHHELVLAGAKAAKHMFVEKPLGITGKESLEMAGAIEKANLLFSTGYFMRGSPIHLFVKEELAKGHFGKV